MASRSSGLILIHLAFTFSLSIIAMYHQTHKKETLSTFGNLTKKGERSSNQKYFDHNPTH